jgi:hypothetical protein
VGRDYVLDMEELLRDNLLELEKDEKGSEWQYSVFCSWNKFFCTLLELYLLKEDRIKNMGMNEERGKLRKAGLGMIKLSTIG